MLALIYIIFTRPDDHGVCCLTKSANLANWDPRKLETQT